MLKLTTPMIIPIMVTIASKTNQTNLSPFFIFYLNMHC